MFCQSCGGPISSSPNVIIDPVTPGHQKKSVGKCIKIQILLQDGGYTVHRAHCYFIQYLEDNHRLRHKLWFATATGWSSGPDLRCFQASAIDSLQMSASFPLVHCRQQTHQTANSRDTKEIPGKNNMKRAKIGFNRHYQPGEGPSKGLLRDCEIFANHCLTFVSSSSRYLDPDHQLVVWLLPRRMVTSCDVT